MQTNILNCVPKVVLRNTIRLYVRRATVQNPGLQSRIDLLEEKQQTNDLHEDDFEGLETDFMSTNEVYKQHKKEAEQLAEKQKLWIVRRKYFKETQVNFLTWNDKEQIRFLYNTYPEEWTIERLSEGFPATTQTISKIINGKWQPRSEQRIKNHDLSVEKNWKLLKDGELSHLSKEVLNHVLKFSDRKPRINFLSEKIVIKQHKIGSQPGEFGSIIDNYNKMVNQKNGTDKSENQLVVNEPIDEPEKYTTRKTDNKLTTLGELRKDIEKNIELGKNVDEYDKMILKESRKNIEPVKKPESDYSLNSLSNSTYVVQTDKLVANEEKKVFEALHYPERIEIPKEKFRKGFTYKVKDCYYDDDGEFLYRVPGMN